MRSLDSTRSHIKQRELIISNALKYSLFWFWVRGAGTIISPGDMFVQTAGALRQQSFWDRLFGRGSLFVRNRVKEEFS